jgi:hypothetical protein
MNGVDAAPSPAAISAGAAARVGRADDRLRRSAGDDEHGHNDRSALSTMACLLLFAGLDPNLTGRQAQLVMIALGALIVVRSFYIGLTWLERRKDLADVRAAIASIAPGTRVLTARRYPDDLVYNSSPERLLPGRYPTDNHLPALLLIERRASWLVNSRVSANIACLAQPLMSMSLTDTASASSRVTARDFHLCRMNRFVT